MKLLHETAQLPALTREELEALAASINIALTSYDALLDVSLSDELRNETRRRVILLASLRTAVLEAKGALR